IGAPLETLWRRSGDSLETLWRRSGDALETLWRQLQRLLQRQFLIIEVDN
ncbi:unnamed protein product, partial [marine sediment metagenome]